MLHICQSGHISFQSDLCSVCQAPIAWSGPWLVQLEIDDSHNEVFSESEIANGSKDRFYSQMRFKIPNE